MEIDKILQNDIIEKNCANIEEYSKISNEIEQKANKIKEISDEILKIKENNEQNLTKILEIEKISITNLMPNIVEIRQKLSTISQAILQISAKIYENEILKLNTDFSNKTHELQTDLADFEKKKLEILSHLDPTASNTDILTPQEPPIEIIKPEPPKPIISLSPPKIEPKISEYQNLTQEEKLIKCIENNDTITLKQVLQNKALFNTIFTVNNLNLTMLILEKGNTDTFLFYMDLIRSFGKQIKFTQKNTVFFQAYFKGNRKVKIVVYLQ